MLLCVQVGRLLECVQDVLELLASYKLQNVSTVGQCRVMLSHELIV